MQGMRAEPAGLRRPSAGKLLLHRQIVRFDVSPNVILGIGKETACARWNHNLPVDRRRHGDDGNAVADAADRGIGIRAVEDRSGLLREALHAGAGHAVLERRNGKTGADHKTLESAVGDAQAGREQPLGHLNAAGARDAAHPAFLDNIGLLRSECPHGRTALACEPGGHGGERADHLSGERRSVRGRGR